MLEYFFLYSAFVCSLGAHANDDEQKSAMRRAEDKVMVSMFYDKDTDKSMTGIKVGDFEAKSETIPRVMSPESEGAAAFYSFVRARDALLV